MPPMRDRQTMARRVRGYVTQSKTNISLGSNAPGRATSSERKALATMGRKGGQKAAQRWKTDPEGQYAQTQRDTLKAANMKRAIQGKSTRARILNTAMDSLAQTGRIPTSREIAEELGVTKRTVNLHLKALRESGMLD